MTYHVEFTTAAARQVRKLSRPVRDRVLDAIEDLGEDPRPHGATKLVGEQTAWRIRIGDYRVIYDVFDSELVVTVVRAGHRREVYNRQQPPSPTRRGQPPRAGPDAACSASCPTPRTAGESRRARSLAPTAQRTVQQAGQERGTSRASGTSGGRRNVERKTHGGVPTVGPHDERVGVCGVEFDAGGRGGSLETGQAERVGAPPDRRR